MERSQSPRAEPVPAAKFVGQSLNAQGNRRALTKREPGRRIIRRSGPGRPEGTSDPRYSTGINPLPSITGDLYLPGS